MGQRKVDQLAVEVVATEMVVAVAGQHLHHVAFQVDDRHVEGAAAQVVHQGLARTGVAAFVGQRGGGRLVDDAHHLQPGHLAGFARGLPLRVGEEGRHGDDRLVHLGAQVVLRQVLQAAQDHGRDLLRRVVLVGHAHGGGFAHASLDRPDRALGVHGILVAGGRAHQQGAVVADAHHRGQDAHRARHRDDLDAAVAHDGDLGVGRAQVDADDGGCAGCGHDAVPFLLTMTSALRNSTVPC